MAASAEEWIRQRAYRLWEEEGYPSGKDQEHWERASLEYTALNPTSPDLPAKGRKTAGNGAASNPPSDAAASLSGASKPSAKKAASAKPTQPKETGAGKPAKPKAENSVVAAAVTAEQTKKRPRKAAAE